MFVIDGGCESGDAVVVCGVEGADRKCYGRGRCAHEVLVGHM